MEYFSLEASRMASSRFRVVWTSLLESSATTIFQWSSLAEAAAAVVVAPSLEDLGLFRWEIEERIDLNIPFGLAIERRWTPPLLFSSGTTEIFSRLLGRHLLQETPVDSSVSGRFLDEPLLRCNGVGLCL